MPVCQYYCKIFYPNHSAVRRHQAHAPVCREARDHALASLFKQSGDSATERTFELPSSSATAAGIDNDTAPGVASEGGQGSGPDDPTDWPMEEDSGSGTPFPMESSEDACDEGWSGQVWREDPPAQLQAGRPNGQGLCPFELLRQEQARDSEGLGRGIWGPFANEDEWQLAQWLIKNVGHNQAEKFLNLNIVSIDVYSQ